MKRLFILTASILLADALAAQPSFKELHEKLLQNDRFSNMLDLRTYQQANPEHAITYFLLGEIYDFYMRETDPTRQFMSIETNYNQARTYYGLVLVKLDERQAREDREYYVGIEKVTDKKKIGYPDIIHETQMRIEENEAYYNDAKTVYMSYTNCINQYNECLFSFRQIVSGFPYYKDLYLLSTPEMTKKIVDLSANYSESLKNFRTFREACKKMPHLMRTPEVIEMPVITYRLEGLVESDFNADTVRLWNFGQWANDYLAVMNGDIKTIREKLIATDQGLDRQIDRLRNEDLYSDEIVPFKPEERFQFLIGKYDPHALCNKLLDYKSSKIDFLTQTRLAINDPQKATENYLNNRLRYYRDLAFQLDALNKEADSLKKAVSLDDIDKHFAFFERQYKGMDGLKRWCDVEKYKNSTWFNQNLSNLAQFIGHEDGKNHFDGQSAIYNKKCIAIGVQALPYSIGQTDTLITLLCAPQGKTDRVVSGISFNKNRLMSSFIACIDSSKQVKWMARPDTRQLQNSWPTHLVAVNDSTTLLLVAETSSENGIQSNRNHLLRFNKKGELIFSGLADSTGYPRLFQYNDISDDYLIVTKGKERLELPDENEQATISLLDSKLDKKWEKRYSLQGNLIELLMANGNFLVVGHANELVSSTGKIFETNLPDGFSIFIDREGKSEKIHRYIHPQGINLTSAHKVSGNNLILFGHEQERTNGQGHLFLLVGETGQLLLKNPDEIKTE